MTTYPASTKAAATAHWPSSSFAPPNPLVVRIAGPGWPRPTWVGRYLSALIVQGMSWCGPTRTLTRIGTLVNAAPARPAALEEGADVAAGDAAGALVRAAAGAAAPAATAPPADASSAAVSRGRAGRAVRRCMDPPTSDVCAGSRSVRSPPGPAGGPEAHEPRWLRGHVSLDEAPDQGGELLGTGSRQPVAGRRSPPGSGRGSGPRGRRPCAAAGRGPRWRPPAAPGSTYATGPGGAGAAPRWRGRGSRCAARSRAPRAPRGAGRSSARVARPGYAAAAGAGPTAARAARGAGTARRTSCAAAAAAAAGSAPGRRGPRWSSGGPLAEVYVAIRPSSRGSQVSAAIASQAPSSPSRGRRGAPAAAGGTLASSTATGPRRAASGGRPPGRSGRDERPEPRTS